MMMKLLIVTIVILLAALAINKVVDLTIFPVVSMDYGVRQLEDSNEIFQEREMFEWGRTVFAYSLLSVTGLLVLAIWWKTIGTFLKGGKR